MSPLFSPRTPPLSRASVSLEHLCAVINFPLFLLPHLHLLFTCVGQVTLCPSFGTFATDAGPGRGLWAPFTSQTGLCGSQVWFQVSLGSHLRWARSSSNEKIPAQIWFWGGVKAARGSAAAGILAEVDLFTRADAPSSPSTPRLMCPRCLFKG